MSNNVHDISKWLKPPGELHQGGEPPYDGGMEARISKLEAFAQEARDRLVRIESTMATKTEVSDLRAEMHKEFTTQTWRIIGAMLTFGTLLTGATFFIAKIFH